MPVNGKFGAKTERAVRTFQRHRDLPATGAVDDPTWPLLLTVEPDRVRWARRGNPMGARRAWPAAPATASLPPVADEIPPPEDRR